MTSLVVDSGNSRARIRTFAEGFFSRLAHDLELVCRELRGTATVSEDGLGTAMLDVPIAAIDIAGTLKGDRVEPDRLSQLDRTEIIEKMRREVFHVSASEGAVVRVEASLVDRRHARVRVVMPLGRTVEHSIRVVFDEADGRRVSGKLEVSIAALGGGVVKGPMNAFRLKDTVEIAFDLVWRQPA